MWFLVPEDGAILLQVKELNKDLYKAELIKMPRKLKQKVIDDILRRFGELNGTASIDEQRGMYE